MYIIKAYLKYYHLYLTRLKHLLIIIYDEIKTIAIAIKWQIREKFVERQRFVYLFIYKANDKIRRRYSIGIDRVTARSTAVGVLVTVSFLPDSADNR